MVYMKWRFLGMETVRHVQWFSRNAIFFSFLFLFIYYYWCFPYIAVSCTFRTNVQVTWVSQACSEGYCETGRVDLKGQMHRRLIDRWITRTSFNDILIHYLITRLLEKGEWTTKKKNWILLTWSPPLLYCWF